MKKGLRDGGGCSKGSSGRMGIRENWSLYRLYMTGGWVDVKFNGEIRTKEAYINIYAYAVLQVVFHVRVCSASVLNLLTMHVAGQ